MAPTICQVIDGKGEIHEKAVEAFIKKEGVAVAKTNYQIVAIMGPQSSGKSTLLNHLFGTRFEEMDAERGRQQTTKGVWMAKSPKVEDICTLVMDLEGSDGRERGEDDTNFERQSALFALAVADVLLVNIWCHDIGREQGSGKPLMKTIFQVNLKLFAPEPNRRKTTLLFVIRDKSKTPMTRLSEILMEDLTRMWEGISKPPQYKDSAITDFFEVRFAGLPHYEERQEDFLADATVLRRRFMPDGDDTLVIVHDNLPADSLALSMASIWGVIHSQKDLNLPAHKIMVAEVRCKQIKQDQLTQFEADQAWTALVGEADASVVHGFGRRASSLYESCVAGYDADASYFDTAVRSAQRIDLLSALQQLLAAPLNRQLDILTAQQLASFDKDFRLGLTGTAGLSQAADSAAEEALRGFDATCKEVLIPGVALTADDARSGLQSKIDAQVARAKADKLKQAKQAADKALQQLITVPAVELLTACPPGLWDKLHGITIRATAAAEKQLFEEVKGVRLAPQERDDLSASLEQEAAAKLHSLVSEAALTRVPRMKEKFHEVFAEDENGTPRTWRPKDNIPQLAKSGRLAAAGVLASLAVWRPSSPDNTADGPSSASGPSSAKDEVRDAIMSMATAELEGGKGKGTDGTAKGGVLDLASMTTWPGIASEDVLISPQEARLAWREFMSASGLSVQQAMVTQQANIAAGKRAPPVWALGMMLLLGWNEMMAVLWNPVYMILAIVVGLFTWQMYRELDVDAELQKGALPGALALAAKLPDTFSSVWHNTLAQLLEFITNAPSMLAQGAEAAREHMSHPNSGRTTPTTDGAPGSPSARHQRQHVSGEGLARRKRAEGVQMTVLPKGQAADHSATNGAEMAAGTVG